MSRGALRACLLVWMLAQATACGPSQGQLDGQEAGGGSASPNLAGAGADSDARGAGAGGEEASEPDPVEDPQCPAPGGQYEARYTLESGTCGEIAAPLRVPLDGGRTGVGTTIQNLASFSVTTEIMVDGCSLGFVQTTMSQTGAITLRIEAESLTLEADGRITGQANVTRFDDDGQPECTGTYAVELMRSGRTIGSAVGSGEAGAGDAGAELSAEALASVQYDCQQTVQCIMQRGETVPDDPITRCVDDTSRALVADEARLARFLEVVAACEPFVVCDYVACAAAQP